MGRFDEFQEKHLKNAQCSDLNPYLRNHCPNFSERDSLLKLWQKSTEEHRITPQLIDWFFFQLSSWICKCIFIYKYIQILVCKMKDCKQLKIFRAWNFSDAFPNLLSVVCKIGAISWVTYKMCTTANHWNFLLFRLQLKFFHKLHRSFQFY